MAAMAHTMAWYPKISLLASFGMIWLMIPNPGRIRIYTSGCPKNQKMCWKRIGSPPPTAAKNVVLKWRSVNSIVIPAANAGRATTRRIDVMRTDQTKSGMRNSVIPAGRMFTIVTIMLIAPRIDEAPAMCLLRMAKSTDAPAWAVIDDSGGYSVHPVPAPSRNIDPVKR